MRLVTYEGYLDTYGIFNLIICMIIEHKKGFLGFSQNILFRKKNDGCVKIIRKVTIQYL